MTDASATAKADVRRWFYHWMALACLAFSIIGFLPTYFAPMVQGTFLREPIVHLHGLLFFAWVTFFCWQTWLVAAGRTSGHREWGLLGIAIATAMAFSTLTVDIVRMNNPVPGAIAPPEPVLMMGQLTSILFFETCVVVALANVRRPEVHKRFMLLATISILGAPAGRWWLIILADSFAALASGGQPDLVTLAAMMFGIPGTAALFIIVAMVFDWGTRRRVSPIYWIGLPAFMLTPILGMFAASAPAWLAFVEWLKTFGG
jgi:hypothetical protein